VMFFALSFMPQHEAPAVLADDIAEQREELIETERSLAETRAEMTGEHLAMGRLAMAEAEKRVAEARADLTRLETEQREGRADGLKPGSWQANIKDMATGDETHDGTGELKVMGKTAKAEGHGFGATVMKKLQNPDLALYKLQQTMYKFAFL